jgi:hypothetical protein
MMRTCTISLVGGALLAFSASPLTGASPVNLRMEMDCPDDSMAMMGYGLQVVGLYGPGLNNHFGKVKDGNARWVSS